MHTSLYNDDKTAISRIEKESKDTESKESSDNMMEIQDILDQYETLKNANDDLLHKMGQNNMYHEQIISSHIQLTIDGGNYILNNSNL